MFQIEMLPAGRGDCLWIEYGSCSDVHRILIDGGPEGTYDVLRERILALPPAERRFELIVLTHVDRDHIAGLIPLGVALESSGAADWTVQQLLALTGEWGPTAVLSAFFLAALGLTGVMSNTATAALLAPLAIGLATTLDVDARPFLIALTFAASAAFYTPIGYQTNLLVFGPGGYRFADFIKVGGPLALLYWLMATLLIPMLFPF